MTEGREPSNTAQAASPADSSTHSTSEHAAPRVARPAAAAVVLVVALAALVGACSNDDQPSAAQGTAAFETTTSRPGLLPPLPTEPEPTTTTAAPDPEPPPEWMVAEGRVPEATNFVAVELSDPDPEPPTTTAAPDPEPPPEWMVAEGRVPEATNFVAVELSDPDPEPPTTTAAPDPEPEPTTTTAAPDPDPEPTTTTAAPDPQPEPTTTTAAPEPEPNTITRESLCILVGGTWDPSGPPPQCQDPTRVFEPLPVPVGEPVTLETDEDDSFVSGSGRRVVRFEPATIEVGTVLGRYEDGSVASIVTEIEDLGSGWWQVVVCTSHESFVLAEVGNVGWQFVAYAWREDDGRFRIEQDNWGPGNDGPC